MKQLYITVLIASLLISCNRGLKKYKDNDLNFYPIEPEVTVYFNEERQGFYKVIYFDSYYELSHPMYSSLYNTKIEAGYHLYDNKGYNGYDFDHTFLTPEAAINHALRCGDAYFFKLGNQYQFRDGKLYSTIPFKALEIL